MTQEKKITSVEDAIQLDAALSKPFPFTEFKLKVPVFEGGVNYAHT